MSCCQQSSWSQASTAYDDPSFPNAGSASCIDDWLSTILSDYIPQDEDHQIEDVLPRGWRMRQGHLKMLERPKKGKTAISGETPRAGDMVSRGRSAFKRSVNGGSRCKHDHLLKHRRKSTKRHAWQCEISCEALDYAEDDWCWEETSILDEESEWAPINKVVLSKKQPRIAAAQHFREKKPCLNALARKLRRYGGILEKETLRGKVRFADVQRQFLQEHGPRFCTELSSYLRRAISLKAAPVSANVQQRFVDACSTLQGTLRPGYHGTNTTNLLSIYQHGLLIPGNDNRVRVINGSAHGIGIYTAEVNFPSLSWGFCQAAQREDKKIMVCGVLDDAPKVEAFETYSMGTRTVSTESASVRHVGSAMVIFDHRRVVPLFEASLRPAYLKEEFPVRWQTQVFDWAGWFAKVKRVFSTWPLTKKAKGPLAGQQVKQHTVTAFVSRRAARKRNQMLLKQ